MAEYASSVLTQDEVYEVLRNALQEFVCESSDILLEELQKKKYSSLVWSHRQGRSLHSSTKPMSFLLTNEAPFQQTTYNTTVTTQCNSTASSMVVTEQIT
uniref:Uncharacterized protein n=1 Tax=Graphocephala atropunctata TaxID=36148 RepID=A0A1B6MIF5_9HEMI